MLDSVNVELRIAGVGRKRGLLIEHRSGYSRSGDGTYLHQDRRIDHRSPGALESYWKVITDPETGGLVHSCIEPLGAHRGRGSARQTPVRGRKRAT
jgi:hypothetical protein